MQRTGVFVQQRDSVHFPCHIGRGDILTIDDKSQGITRRFRANRGVTIPDRSAFEIMSKSLYANII